MKFGMLYWISPKIHDHFFWGLEWESNLGSTLFQVTSKDIFPVFMVHGLWMMCTMKTRNILEIVFVLIMFDLYHILFSI